MSRARPPVALAAAIVLGCLLLIAGAGAATSTYSSGALRIPIRDGETIEQSVTVREAGPVWHLAVAVRLDHERDSDLALSLVAPDGTPVRLATHEGGTRRNLGSGNRNCSGFFAVFDDSGTQTLRSAEPPLEGQFRPEERLSHLYGKQARGQWTLRVSDDGVGKAGTLLCWQLDLSRNVVEVKRAADGRVRAELSYRERAFTYRDVRLRILRAGKALVARPLPEPGCSGRCPYFRPFMDLGSPITVRDLDGDREPEVLVDTFSGGAHCCIFTVFFRYRASSRSYAVSTTYWGNVGYRLADFDRNGLPELASADDTFAYAFTSFAASFDPIRILHFRQGKLVDVTRRFPAVVRRDAARLWGDYRRVRKSQYPDVRGVLAAYIADKYLLGEQKEGWKQLEGALKRGELGRSPEQDGYPAGRLYVTKLRGFLRHYGYAR